jgi:hypothetical protein
MSDKIISAALDIEHFDSSDTTVYTATTVETNNVEEDYALTRGNLRTILDTGMNALEKMAEIADLSQHPKSYEALSSLIRNLSSVNKELMELSEKKVNIERNSNTQHQTINNNLFISTTELQKLLMKKSNE